MKKLLVTGCSFAYGLGLELFHPDINGKDWPERTYSWNDFPENIKEYIQI